MTDEKHLPEITDTVIPYLTVEEPDRLIDFLIRVFNATIIKENRYPDNRLQHARVSIGNSLIMMNEASQGYPPIVSQLHLLVEDCDTVHKRATGAGATSIMSPNLRPHGDRMAGIKDPCGNIWWIASHTDSN